MILLAAAGVKIREGKQLAAARHAATAAALFSSVRSSRRSEISSSLHITDAPLSPLTFIASAQWRIGKL
ncbi:hypothetical protein CIT26_30135 [Mesorhizobium temperatum]|uniref:Uncharacterized protein n=1 Tax=Mesorhizobium temperatum TaxID=241416 RepID=A0A271LD68_9HYPH|nr:hypothetical protein CIT26_30135 [Mesorhizobium temperatum]